MGSEGGQDDSAGPEYPVTTEHGEVKELLSLILEMKIKQKCLTIVNFSLIVAHPDIPEDVLDPGLAMLDDQEVSRRPSLPPDVLVMDVHIGQEAAVPGLQVGEDGHQLLSHRPPAAHTQLAGG